MSEPVVLVTGGAGYIGSHTCLRLSEAGFRPVVYDNLSNGWASFARGARWSAATSATAPAWTRSSPSTSRWR